MDWWRMTGGSRNISQWVPPQNVLVYLLLVHPPNPSCNPEFDILVKLWCGWWTGFNFNYSFTFSFLYLICAFFLCVVFGDQETRWCTTTLCTGWPRTAEGSRNSISERVIRERQQSLVSVCVCVCVCACMHACMRVYLCERVYVCIHAYLCVGVHVHACVCACICGFITKTICTTWFPHFMHFKMFKA